jgi:hypothetical protein
VSSRPILSPFPVITNASMASSVTSSVTIIQNISRVSYDISWTGTPTGTFSVQVSDTYTQNGDGTVANAGNWSTLSLSATPSTGGTSGNGSIDLQGLSFYAVRLVYTAASGTGILNATIAGKVD